MWKCIYRTLVAALGVPVDADVDLSAVYLGSVHQPAGLLSALRRVEPHRPAAL